MAHKFGAKPIEIDGHKFPSQLEGRVYARLKLRERAGEILALTLQPRFKLIVQGALIGTYVGDFQYIEANSGETVIADAKGVRTPVYKMKAKLLKALYGVTILEISR